MNTPDYTTALRQTLRTTAAAYGYTVSIAPTLAILTSVRGKPHAGQLFLFAAGALAAFAVLEAIVMAFTGDGRDSSGAEAFPFAGALNCFSVAAALGAGIGIAHAIQDELAWLVAPLAGTTIYLLVVALQVRVVTQIRS